MDNTLLTKRFGINSILRSSLSIFLCCITQWAFSQATYQTYSGYTNAIAIGVYNNDVNFLINTCVGDKATYIWTDGEGKLLDAQSDFAGSCGQYRIDASVYDLRKISITADTLWSFSGQRNPPFIMGTTNLMHAFALTTFNAIIAHTTETILKNNGPVSVNTVFKLNSLSGKTIDSFDLRQYYTSNAIVATKDSGFVFVGTKNDSVFLYKNKFTPSVPNENIDCNVSIDSNPSQVLCFTENSDSSTELLIASGNSIVKKILDKNGKILTTNTVGSLTQDSIIVRNNQVIKKLANGTVAFSKQIPPSVLNHFPSINAAVEMADGTYVLGGYQKFFGFPDDIPTSQDSLVLVTTDANLNYQSFYIEERNSYRGQFSMVQIDSLLQLIRLDNNHIVAVYNHGEAQLVLNNNLKFSKLLKNGATITRENTNTFFAETIEGTSIFTNLCGNSLIFNTRVRAIAQKGQFIGMNNYHFDLGSLTIKSVKSVGSGSVDRYGNYNRYAYNTPIPGQSSIANISVTYAGDDRVGMGTFEYLLVRFNNPLLAELTHIKTIPFIQFEHIIRTGDTTCLIILSRNGALFAYNPDCLNTPPTPTIYCASKGVVPWELWLANVKFNSINNTSEKFKDFNTVGYSDYTNLSTTIQKGQTYLLNITAGLSWSGILPNAYCRTWIDWNGNNIFEDAELVFQNTNINPFVAAIRIPTSAKAGATRMRIAMKWGSYPTACETFDKGEVEDYTINIQEGSTNPCDNDTQAPVFSNCPQNIVKTYIDCGTFTWTPPTATDNCGTPTITVTSKMGNIVTPNAYTLCVNADTIIYTATDTKGNKAVCSFSLKNDCFDLTDVGSLPQNVTLTTTGTCQPYKWTVPYYTFPCGRGDNKYVGWVAIRSNPQILVSKVVNLPFSQIFQDSACFPIGTTTVVYQGAFQLDSFNISVVQQSANDDDIAVTIIATPSVFRPYTTNTVRITAKNNGNSAFSHIKIEFPFPDKTVTGGSVIPSVGTWKEYCAGNIKCYEWNIPTLAANTIAIVDIPLFILDAVGNISGTAKLLNSTPTDGNSANNSATITLTQSAPTARQATTIQKPTQLIPIVIQKITPTLTEGDIMIEVESLVSKDIRFYFYNLAGKLARTEVRSVQQGNNSFLFDFHQETQGVYMIQTDLGTGHGVPLKFVKF